MSSFTYSSVLDYSILLKDKYNSFNKLLLQQYIIKLLQYLCQISKHNNQVSVGRWQMLSMQFMVISGHRCWSHQNTLVDCSGSACFYTCCPVWHWHSFIGTVSIAGDICATLHWWWIYCTCLLHYSYSPDCASLGWQWNSVQVCFILLL